MDAKQMHETLVGLKLSMNYIDGFHSTKRALETFVSEVHADETEAERISITTISGFIDVYVDELLDKIRVIEL